MEAGDFRSIGRRRRRRSGGGAIVLVEQGRRGARPRPRGRSECSGDGQHLAEAHRAEGEAGEGSMAAGCRRAGARAALERRRGPKVRPLNTPLSCQVLFGFRVRGHNTHLSEPPAPAACRGWTWSGPKSRQRLAYADRLSSSSLAMAAAERLEFGPSNTRREIYEQNTIIENNICDLISSVLTL